jgi:hypothetical protein
MLVRGIRNTQRLETISLQIVGVWRVPNVAVRGAPTDMA